MITIFYFDICALIIISIFLISMIIREQLSNRTNKIMYVMVWLMWIATFVDLAASVVSNFGEPSAVNVAILYICNFCYFLSHNMILPVYVLYVYSSIEIWHLYKDRTKITRLVWFALTFIDIIVALANIPTKLVFTISDKLEYNRGPLLYTFYVVAAVFAVWSMWLIIKYRKLMNADKFVVLSAIFPLVLLGVVIQLINGQILIEMFCAALAFLFFMIVVQRDESMTDPITGALKYNAGIARVSKIFITQKPISVVLVKIANHNNIRLYLGQANYNAFLKSVTTKMRAVSKKNKYDAEVYYLESGLFAFLSEKSELSDAMSSAEDIRDYLKKTCDVDEFQVVPDARVCIIRYPEDVDDFATLYTIGTTFHNTMPETKEILIYSEYRNDENYKMRSEMEDIIASALNEKRMEVHFQPIYSTRKNRYVSAEALIRLYDEKYGYISPSIFLPVAELTGQIHAIGDFVIDEVLRFMSSNDLNKLGLEYLEVNLSAAQCIEADLVDKVISKLEHYGVRPEQLGLELTENAADIDPIIVDNNVYKLHKEGVRFALDDYGTGYSNIKRVTALPIDQVKLDKSFVDNMDNPQMWIVIQDTIAMLREMGKEVLVEGVESEEVAKHFVDINADLFQGCELIQGFYFCKPMPEMEFVNFMEEHAGKNAIEL